MEEIEVLLLLSREARPMTVEEIRAALRLPASDLPMSSVTRLVAADLVTAEQKNGIRFRYAPATPELRRAVELLAVAYNERPVTLVRLVYNRPSAAQSFADAFRIKKDLP
jgi:DNA-binding transcriptional regulator GbsR (MarR family)